MGGEPEGIGDVDRDFIQGFVQLGLGNFKAVEGEIVDTENIVKQGRVALGADVVEDAGYGVGQG